MMITKTMGLFIIQVIFGLQKTVFLEIFSGSLLKRGQEKDSLATLRVGRPGTSPASP